MIGLQPYGDVEIPDPDDVRARFDAALVEPIGPITARDDLLYALGLREATG